MTAFLCALAALSEPHQMVFARRCLAYFRSARKCANTAAKMRYRNLLVLLGGALVALGVVEGRWWSIAIWLGCDFMILGVAHGRGAHRVFGKCSDGSLPLWSWILFFPLLLYTMGVWHLARCFSREPACNVVTDGLVVGRRLLARERKEEFANYIDLTAEFSEPPVIRGSPSYLNFPILDGGAPETEAVRKAVAELRPGSTFIHCAQGHGRTGLFALAILLSSGAATHVDEGLRMLRAVRPGIRLNQDQRACIERYAAELARG